MNDDHFNSDLDHRHSHNKGHTHCRDLNQDQLFNIKIWRVKEVASFLGCSRGHVYNLVSDQKIPKRKKGRLLYFVPNEILNWILEGV